MSDFSPEASSEAAPPLTVEEAIANLRGPDLSLRYYAAWWLGKFRVSDPAVVDVLIEALEDEADLVEPEVGEGPLGEARGVLARHRHRAGAGRVHARTDGAGLAAARPGGHGGGALRGHARAHAGECGDSSR